MAAQGKKGPTADDVMDVSELKPLLAMARRGETPACAIGLTKDKDAVVLLDKKMKPKAVLTNLKKTAIKTGLELDTVSLRFGRLSINNAVDAGLAVFTVNKDAPGAMRAKLLLRMKEAGIPKVEITTDSGLEAEPEQDEAPEQQAAPAAPPHGAAPQPQAAPPPAQPEAAPQAQQPQQPGPAAQPQQPQAQQAQPGPDAAKLNRTLAGLVGKIATVLAADPTNGNKLKQLAQDANTALKAGDTAGAEKSVHQLEQELANAQPAAPANAQPAQANGAAPNMASFDKARAAWVAARKKVESELDKLHKEMTAAYKGHGFAADLDRVFHAKIEPVMQQLDESLAHKLDEVTKNTEAAAHAKLVREAKQLMQNYQTFLDNEPLIAKLDANPFVPLQIEKTLSATLAALSKVIA